MTKRNPVQVAALTHGGQFIEQDHSYFFEQATGRKPSMFERATAESLIEASHDARTYSGAFTAVSTATGSGKTTGAASLLWHNYTRHGLTGALVIASLEECDKVYRSLAKVLPAGAIAIHTSIHKIGASQKVLDAKKEELRLKPAASYTADQFKAAPIVICTHERWRNEITSGKDNGVRLCSGKQRDLVVIDEEPNLERIFVRKPSDVSLLMDALRDVVDVRGKGAVGFEGSHFATPVLARIYNLMRQTHDRAERIPWLYSQDALVSAEDVATLERIKYEDITIAHGRLLPEARLAVADHDWGTIEFLKAAAQGRVFYSKDGEGAFYAYAFIIPVQPNTLILDGTADINGMYAIGKHVRLAKLHRYPTYDNLRLIHVTPPAAFAGEMKPTGILKTIHKAKPYMEWLKTYLLENTKPGSDVLVYAKQDLLAYGIHKDWHERDVTNTIEHDVTKARCRCLQCLNDDQNYCDVQGRHIHWCHFGRGRGSNEWQHCTVYFRLGDWHQKKAVTLAKVGSCAGVVFSPKDLNNLSSGTTRHPLYMLAQKAHLTVTTKQDTARICIRNLDDDGRPRKPAVAHFVDCDLRLLQSTQAAMFPGSAPIVTPGRARVVQRESGDGPQLLRDLLLSHREQVLTGDVIKEVTGIGSNYIDRALTGGFCSQTVDDLGWVKTTRSKVGLPGKGYVLLKAA